MRNLSSLTAATRETEAQDIWWCGNLFLKICVRNTNNENWDESCEEELDDMACSCVSNMYSPDLCTLLKRMKHANPSKRGTICDSVYRGMNGELVIAIFFIVLYV